MDAWIHVSSRDVVTAKLDCIAANPSCDPELMVTVMDYTARPIQVKVTPLEKFDKTDTDATQMEVETRNAKDKKTGAQLVCAIIPGGSKAYKIVCSVPFHFCESKH